MTKPSLTKPKLLPVSVPWSVAASMPFLKAKLDAEQRPLWVTFVGYFRLDDRADEAEAPISYVTEEPDFVPGSMAQKVPYRMVRIVLAGGLAVRTRHAFSEHQTVPKKEYDWSAVPGALLPGEDTMAYMERVTDYQLRTGLSPDPDMYEVIGSTWAAEFREAHPHLKHYLIRGDETYLEILAQGWSWEPGQPVD